MDNLIDKQFLQVMPATTYNEMKLMLLDELLYKGFHPNAGDTCGSEGSESSEGSENSEGSEDSEGSENSEGSEGSEDKEVCEGQLFHDMEELNPAPDEWGGLLSLAKQLSIPGAREIDAIGGSAVISFKADVG